MKKNDYHYVSGMVDTIEYVNHLAKLYQNEVGIHTFELKRCCNDAQKESQLKSIWEVLKSGQPMGKRMIKLQNGLWAEMTYGTSDWYEPILKMVVNPRVLVSGQDGYLGITDRDTLDSCCAILEKFWQEHGVEMQIENCILSRADLCMNLEMESSFLIPGYIELLKRTPHNSKYKLCTLPSKQDSPFYVGFTNNSRRLCVYDKAHEQKRFSLESVARCPNLMRVELQLYRGGLKKVSDSQESVENKMFLHYLVQKAPEILCEGICLCLPGEPYVRQEILLQRLEQHTEFRSQTREWMLELQRRLGGDETYDQVAQNCDRAILRKLCRSYGKMGISPACIRVEGQPEFLPSLPALAVKVLKDAGKLN